MGYPLYCQPHSLRGDRSRFHRRVACPPSVARQPPPRRAVTPLLPAQFANFSTRSITNVTSSFFPPYVNTEILLTAYYLFTSVSSKPLHRRRSTLPEVA